MSTGSDGNDPAASADGEPDAPGAAGAKMLTAHAKGKGGEDSQKAKSAEGPAAAQKSAKKSEKSAKTADKLDDTARDLPGKAADWVPSADFWLSAEDMLDQVTRK